MLELVFETFFVFLVNQKNRIYKMNIDQFASCTTDPQKKFNTSSLSIA